ncbi:hypothetical protein DL96DRAFT_1596527 [Flagelloscypha sp. PMI_526]|nr:hypothetical protein DL96DRAFT_1596527 [Flagelloscypha sp. PMI_526]
MRSSLALLLFSLATFVAAAVPGLPSCANSCADQAASTSGCSSTDTTCLCNSKSFVGATKQCAVHACGQDDQTTLNTALSDFCKQGSSSAPQDTGISSLSSF